jgi:hypothetical protein
MHEGIAHLAELYPNCFRQPRQPLKIGIHNDVIARHPELRPSLIASALKDPMQARRAEEMLPCPGFALPAIGDNDGRPDREQLTARRSP